MRTAIIAASVILLSAGIASAKPIGHGAHAKGASKAHATKYQRVARLTKRERRRIARSRARLNQLARRIRADGRVTRKERQRLREATRRHNALVRRERRD